MSTERFISNDTLTEWFGYHPPSSDNVRIAHELVRDNCADLAEFFNDVLPECPDKTVALRAVREAMYHANACIAVKQRVHPGFFKDDQGS